MKLKQGNPRPLFADGELFLSQKAAADHYGIRPQSVTWRLNSLTFPEWTYADDGVDLAMRRME